MEQEIYMNRELSWLKFNERVLEEAENEHVPLAERLSFEAIYQSNLDEFFMVRVGSLLDQMILSGDIRENKTNMTPKEQINQILKVVRKLNKRKDAVYEALMDKIEEIGVTMVNFQRLSIEESAYLEVYFDSEILPLLSPTIVGKRQPFPFLKNRDIYAVCVLQTKSGKEKLGIVPCSRNVFPELVELMTKNRFMLTEELILHFLPKVFAGYKILSKSLMRITRNADIDADALYDEDLDYREFMVELIKKRKKLAPLRLELSRDMDDTIVKTLCNYLELDMKQVFRSFAPLDLSFVYQLQDRLRTRPELFFEKRIPQPSPEFDLEQPILPQIRKKDKLLSYPFESMKPFNEYEKDGLKSYDDAFLVRFTYESNAIEGSTLSLGDTELVLEGEFTPNNNQRLREIFSARGCADGCAYIEKELENDRKFTENFIKDIHERTTLDCQPRIRGTYIIAPVYIQGSLTEPVDPIQIRELMPTMLYAYENSDAHPIAKAAAFHAMFENIHPFQDGNGRTGRLILNYMLEKEGYPPIALKHDAKQDYKKSLEEWQVRGNPKMFLNIVKNCVLDELQERIRIITVTRETMKALNMDLNYENSKEQMELDDDLEI